MTDENFDLTRRKVLGSIGVVGVAGAAAGYGTTAYFSDEESFDNNTLAAGELDLKVDWQQTYNGPNPMTEAVEPHPVSAYPDTDGDGVQDLEGVTYSGAGDIAEPVFNAADVPACCDCDEGEYYLTYGGETYCIEPLSKAESIEDFYDYIEGVGDDATNSSANEGIQREDTSVVFLYEDGDSNLSLVFVHDENTSDDGGAASVTVEGAPKGANPWIQDDGEWQVKDDGEGSEPSGFEDYEEWEVDWAWGSDRTDGGAIGSLGDDFAVRVDLSVNENAERYSSSIADGDVDEFVVLSGGEGFGEGSDVISLEEGLSGDPTVGELIIHSACGIGSGAELETPAVFQSEYYPDQQHLIEFDDVKPGDEGEITFSLHLCDNPGHIWLKAANYYEEGGTLTEPEAVAINESDSNETDVGDITADDDPGHLAENVDVTVWYDLDCDNKYDEGESEIFAGTLAGLMDEFNAGDEGNEEMIPLSATGAGFADDCFPAEKGVCLGFKWEVSPEVGNIIQGDEVGFDLGFYTEQCRHNDGEE